MDSFKRKKVKKVKDAVKLIIKAGIFIIVGLIIICIITPIFIPKWCNKNYGGVTRRISGIYEEPKDTIDVVVLGNSDAYNAIIPMEIWNEQGITSYHIGTPCQTTWVSYYLLKDFYKRQSPKLAIIDVDFIFEEKDRKYAYVEQVLDNMPWSKNKIDFINDKALNLSIKHKVKYCFPILGFHSRWKEIDIEEVKSSYSGYDVPFKGYEFSKKSAPYKQGKKKKDSNKTVTKIPENSEEYLKKIIEECNSHGTEVLLVYVPSAKSWSKEKAQLAQEFAKENNLKYIDYNNDDFDWKHCTRDKGKHLNVYGAQVVTKELENTLKEYNLPNHKDDDKYQEWNLNYEKYLSLL